MIGMPRSKVSNGVTSATRTLNCSVVPGVASVDIDGRYENRSWLVPSESGAQAILPPRLGVRTTE